MGERAEQPVGRLHQHDADHRHLGPGEVAGDDLVEQLLQGAGHLDAGRAAAADDDGQLALGRARGAGRGPLEPVEDGPAQAHGVVHRLQSGRRARARPGTP